jgi:RHS repeat-associated protein
VLEAQVYYYHNDLLGSPIYVTDIDGSVVWKGDYPPFGEPLQDIDTVYWGNAYTYLGNEDDGGLMYFNARYYAKELGRFMSCDPIKDMASSALTINPYVYCGNNPLVFKDPLGLRQAPGPSWGDDEPGGGGGGTSRGFWEGQGFDTWGGQPPGCDASGTGWEVTFYYTTLWMDIAREHGGTAADFYAPMIYRTVMEMTTEEWGCAGVYMAKEGIRIFIREFTGDAENAGALTHFGEGRNIYINDKILDDPEYWESDYKATLATIGCLVAHEVYHAVFGGPIYMYSSVEEYIAHTWGYAMAERLGGLQPGFLAITGYPNLGSLSLHGGYLYYLIDPGNLYWYVFTVYTSDYDPSTPEGMAYRNRYLGGIPGWIFRRLIRAPEESTF